MTMGDTMRLSSAVGKATLFLAVGSIGLVLALAKVGFDPDVKATPAILAGLIVTVLLPSFAASAWLLRKLRKTHSVREARAVSIAFGLCAPILLGVSMAFGGVTGGYAEALGGGGSFILVGAFGGPFILTAFLSLLVCAVVLRVTKLTMDVEQNQQAKR
jgi:formate hydrogenlyase subunit 3/multisubunit Na+/H+ antiporter MnhD subunit